MGQICSSAKRIFVHTKVIDQFIERLLNRVSHYPVTPLFGYEAYGRLADEIICGLDNKTTILRGDINKLKNKQTDIFVIKVNDKNSFLFIEEIFGPVFVITEFESDDEVLSLINNSKYGLGCSIYDMKLERAEQIATKVEAGMVFVNSFTTSKSELPWGGIKESGYGRDLWKCGLESFANIKTIKFN